MLVGAMRLLTALHIMLLHLGRLLWACSIVGSLNVK
jgi:hypothetical protein